MWLRSNKARTVRTLAIGDVHGCCGALTSLLGAVLPRAGDLVVFLGDYIDRGPDSRGVIDLLLRLQTECATVFLRGNHEAMILQARDDPTKSNFWQSYGGFQTLLSYGASFRNDWAAVIPESHWAFLERTVRFFETPKHIFVHAGLAADLDLPDQPEWLLYWAPFDACQPHKSGKRMICGHTPQQAGQPKDLGFATCIDTAPAMRGWLTCLEPDSRRYWQANQSGVVRTGRAKR